MSPQDRELTETERAALNAQAERLESRAAAAIAAGDRERAAKLEQKAAAMGAAKTVAEAGEASAIDVE